MQSSSITASLLYLYKAGHGPTDIQTSELCKHNGTQDAKLEIMIIMLYTWYQRLLAMYFTFMIDYNII